MTNGKILRLARRLTVRPLKVGIVGQGVVGTMTAQIVSDAGLRAIGYDRDVERVRGLREQEGRPPTWSVVDNISSLADADVVVIAVRIPIARSGAANRTPLRDLAGALSKFLDRDKLIIVETTLPPGTTRWFAGLLAKGPHGNHAYIAYCPERLKAGQSVDEVRAIPRLVGGLTEDTGRLACTFFKRLGIQAVPVTSPEVAELSKLLENAFLTSGICLVGEVTRAAHALGISATEVASAAATKPDGYLPFWPGAGIGGHCLPNDLRLLKHTCGELGVKVPMLKALDASSAELSSAVLRHLETLMRARGQPMVGARVWILGVGFKAGSCDTTATPAQDLVRMLREKEASVAYSDPLVGSFVVDGRPVERISSGSCPRSIDAALILSGDPKIQLSQLSRRVPVILDLGGTRVMPGIRAKIATL